MPQQNLVSINIPEKDLADIKSAINVLRDKLLPHLKSLPADEKKELPKMGDKTVSFVQKSLDYSVQNKEFIPAFLDTAEFKKDLDNFYKIRELYQPVLQIEEALNDTMFLLGSDAYQAALVYYNSVKGAAKSNIQNADTIYNDLSGRFPGAGAKNSIKKVQQ